MENIETVHVVIAIILNKKNQVLISFRAADAHQGNLWEFPGGKVEGDESAFDALKREISEELNLSILKAHPFKTIYHQYADKSVLLDVWMVDAYEGDASGAEGQTIKWIDCQDLRIEEFPKANKSIINTLILPEKYMITGSFKEQDDFLARLKESIKKGISLVQLRCKNISESEYIVLAVKVQLICRQNNVMLLLNTNPNVFKKIMADGLHLSGQYLHAENKRPISKKYLLSVSCHSLIDIEQAKKLDADIILLSPVKETPSHPGVAGIGWKKFKALADCVDSPIYALGGLDETDIKDAKENGAQGIAAISCFWN